VIFGIIILEQVEAVIKSVLTSYHDHIASWGLCIILLTFTVRLVILPLTIKQFRSMAAMQTIQPKVKQLQNKYKGKTAREDKQEMQKELMELYKENNVNPFASCLPLVVQMPIFIGLYQTLSNFDATSDQAFLFITNIFTHTNELPTWQTVLMVVLYSSSMLGSTLLFSFVQDRQQKYLFASMSVIFIPFILRVPAGVGVYWITTNIWTICQQGLVKRQMAHHFPAVEKEQKQKASTQTRSSRTPPKKPPEQRPRGKSKRRR
jgi:YidC/Oxa1 family membrane protein insertase